MKEPPLSPQSGEVDDLQALFDAAARPATLPKEDRQDLENELLEVFRAQHSKRRLSRRNFKVWLTAASVAFALVAATMIYLSAEVVAQVQRLEHGEFVSNNGRPLNPGQSIRRGAHLKTVANSTLTLAIGDVSIRLAGGGGQGADFEILARDHFRLTSGRLYFDRAVPGDALTLDTPWGRIRDIGTQYLVEIHHQGMNVRVREGLAELTSHGNSFAIEEGRMRAIDAAGRTTESADSGTGTAWAWVLETSPPFELQGVSVATFLDWIGRETGLSIEYSSKAWHQSAEQEVLHGAIPELRADQAIDVVLPSTGWPYRKEPTRLLIGDSEAPPDRH